MDRITLNNMVFFGYHGALEQEQEIGGRYEVDIDLIGDFNKPSKSDKLSDAIDYQMVYELVREKVEHSKYHLIERLADEVAEDVLDKFKLNKVNVRLRKRNVPIGGVIDFVEVELSREAVNKKTE